MTFYLCVGKFLTTFLIGYDGGVFVNGTINQTVNSTLSLTDFVDVGFSWWDIFREMLPLLFTRMWELIVSPFRYQDMMWVLFPLVLTLIVLEFYFDRHGDEKLGWAAAVANSLILFIVAVDLLRHSFPGNTPWDVLKEAIVAAFTDSVLPIPSDVFLMILFVGLLGVVITLVNYYHLLPASLAFEVSGHPPVNFITYLAVVIVYTSGKEHAVPLDGVTLGAGALLFVILLFLFFMFKRSIKKFFEGHSKTRNTRRR